MVRQPTQPNQPPRPFSEAQEPAVTSGLFWARIVAYRPLFLLGGLWFSLVGISAIAYSRIMYTEVVMPNAPASPEMVNASLAPGFTSTAPTESLPPSTFPPLPPESAGSPAAPIDPVSTSGLGGVKLWGLFSLVGLCAGGCFLITQQVKAPPRPPKPKKVRPPASPRQAAVSAPHLKRLSPYSPQRDGVVVPGQGLIEAPMQSRTKNQAQTVSRPGQAPRPFRSAPQPAPQPQRPPIAGPSPVSRSADPSSAGHPYPGRPSSSYPSPGPDQRHTPTVVPAEEDHPLDWNEESIAHALDLRQRRSLSSFM